MPMTLWFLLFAGLTEAAPPTGQSIPLEAEQTQHLPKKPTLLEEQSLEGSAFAAKPRISPLWPLASRLDLSTGLLLDENGLSDNWLQNLYSQVGLRFSVQPTHRWSIQTLFWPQQALFIAANFEWTPSRSQLRPYYGIGASHRLLDQTRLSSFIETSRYYANCQLGLEYLSLAGGAYFVELKAWVGGSAPLAQVNFGYSFALE